MSKATGSEWPVKVSTIHNGMDLEAFDRAQGTVPEENNGARAADCI